MWTCQGLAIPLTYLTWYTQIHRRAGLSRSCVIVKRPGLFPEAGFEHGFGVSELNVEIIWIGGISNLQNSERFFVSAEVFQNHRQIHSVARIFAIPIPCLLREWQRAFGIAQSEIAGA